MECQGKSLFRTGPYQECFIQFWALYIRKDIDRGDNQDVKGPEEWLKVWGSLSWKGENYGESDSNLQISKGFP